MIEPKSFHEAVKDKLWVEAMQKEIKAIVENHTWDLIPALPGKSIIGCKWVYTLKYKSDGSLGRYKARLVAKGYNKKHGIDYFETFLPVAKMNAFRIVLALTAIYRWTLYHMDVHNAFLQGDLDETVYMRVPEGGGSLMISRG